MANTRNNGVLNSNAMRFEACPERLQSLNPGIAGKVGAGHNAFAVEAGH